MENSAKTSFEYLRVQSFKQKDFFNEAALYKRAFKQTSPIIDEERIDRTYVNNMIALNKLHH